MTTPPNNESTEDEVLNEEVQETLSDDQAAEKAADTLQSLASKVDENLEGWKRAQADYQNLQKEMQQKMQEVSKFATQQFVLELLPMVDHFKYALAGIPAEDRSNPWAQGIEHIQSNFLNILKNHGVEPMETVGKPFDAQLHESMEEVEGSGKASGTITEEVSSGFTLNGKVIQVARVKVAK